MPWSHLAFVDISFIECLQKFCKFVSTIIEWNFCIFFPLSWVLNSSNSVSLIYLLSIYVAFSSSSFVISYNFYKHQVLCFWSCSSISFVWIWTEYSRGVKYFFFIIVLCRICVHFTILLLLSITFTTWLLSLIIHFLISVISLLTCF